MLTNCAHFREDNKSRTNFGRFGDDDEEDDGRGGAGGSRRFRSRFLRSDEDEADFGNRRFVRTPIKAVFGLVIVQRLFCWRRPRATLAWKCSMVRTMKKTPI